jgi:hypothetical protein
MTYYTDIIGVKLIVLSPILSATKYFSFTNIYRDPMCEFYLPVDKWREISQTERYCNPRGQYKVVCEENATQEGLHSSVTGFQWL